MECIFDFHISEECVLKIRIDNSDFWLHQKQIESVFKQSTQNVSQTISRIYKQHKCDKKVAQQYFTVTQKEGETEKKRRMVHYNSIILDLLAEKWEDSIYKKLKESFYQNEQLAKYNLYLKEQKTKQASSIYINKIHGLKAVADFERDDSFLGNLSDHHIMYKLSPRLITKDKTKAYEFLIEYDINSPATGIYYGCRALTLSGNHLSNLSIFDKEWDNLKDEVAEILSNTFPGKLFKYRFKMTDNGNNNTYWPFWITLYEEENVDEVATRAIRIIKTIYKQKLNLEEDPLPSPMDTPIDPNKESSGSFEKLDGTETAFTNESYKKLIDKLYSLILNADKIQIEKDFNSLIEGLCSLKNISQTCSYEKAYILTGTSQILFAYLIESFIKRYNTKSANITLPSDEISKVFFNEDKELISPNSFRVVYCKDKKRKGRNQNANDANDIINEIFK